MPSNDRSRPEDFGDALLDLQAALPAWWQTRNPDSVLYGLLVSTADATNRLAQTWWHTLQDQSITTVSKQGLPANFAFAWGLQAEEDALGEDGLRAYIEACAQEDGSVRSLENTHFDYRVDAAQDLRHTRQPHNSARVRDVI